MDPTALGLATARSIGKIGAAAVSRYRPVGVARVGSSEDRAQAYRRFLDAEAHHRLALGFSEALAGATDGTHPLSLEVSRDLMATGAELVCALQGVQLCAPDYVIKAAQDVVAALSARGKEGTAPYPDSVVALLNAARHDLDYNPKRWQFWKKWKGVNFTKQKPALRVRSTAASEG
ncbi:hypothetical protein [Streptomyces goshikiensis]|uniref:hypothetical protein n=1 Tax=Streptomyces goshikiensis TaxID=1942 RepID=UPI0036D8B182